MDIAQRLVDAMTGRPPSETRWFLYGAYAELGVEYSEVEDALRGRPDLFVRVGFFYWVLRGSDYDPQWVAELLDHTGGLHVSGIAQALDLDKAFVIETLTSSPDLFVSTGYGPPIWALRVPLPDAVAALHRPVEPLTLRVAHTDVGYESSLLKRKIEAVRERLHALGLGDHDKSRLEQMEGELARVQAQFDRGLLGRVTREVEALEREAHPPRGKELTEPLHPRPQPRFPTAFGVPRNRK